MNYSTIAGIRKSDYLKVHTDLGDFCGGSQMWWKPFSVYPSARGFRSYLYYRRDAAYRMWKFGCGVVALCDLELYLDRSDEPPQLKSREAYMTYVDRLRQEKYPLDRGLSGYVIGLKPWKMTRGLREYLQQKQGK
nr:hypothetical protein [Acetatifactor sp.]